MNISKVCIPVIFAGLATLFASAAYSAPPIQAMTIECNWGTLTMEAIKDTDFEQGSHSADPSGDGHGPGTADEPRRGLANVVEQGNLELTCQFIEDLLLQ
ncbi:hypothetical protein [Vibrio sp. YIC-376]|uniref:hypothetical protein n=1 Tax=Vibrio sp. YIC-376 TaxID=3136162 RepID=UPI00402B0465